jgi:hypothetical protein
MSSGSTSHGFVMEKFLGRIVEVEEIFVPCFARK